MRKITFIEKKEIIANKEKLEAEIDEIAIEYSSLSKQEHDKDDIINLKKQLLEYIYIYCRDHLFHIQKFIPKNDVVNLEKDYKFVYFHFSQEILELFDKCIKKFDSSNGNKFTHFWNVSLERYFPESMRKSVYNEHKSPASVPLSRNKINYRIKKGSQILTVSGKIPDDYNSWTQADIELISKHCYCTINDINIYINQCHNFSHVKTESQNYSDDDDYIFDPKNNLESSENTAEEVINKINFNDSGCIEKINLTFSKTDEHKKPYYKKLLTRIFIEMGFKNIDYPFIDTEYAQKIDDEFIKSGKYPSFKTLGDEYGDTNPTQTLDRFFKSVRV